MARGTDRPGGTLIEMCWRLIDVLALVSGLFQTTVLIAGFTSHRKNQYGQGDQGLFFASIFNPFLLGCVLRLALRLV